MCLLIYFNVCIKRLVVLLFVHPTRNYGSVAKRCGKFVQSCIFAFMETKILEQLARIVLPSEILERFEIVKIETDEQDIDAMSMTIHLDERMNKDYRWSIYYYRACREILG